MQELKKFLKTAVTLISQKNTHSNEALIRKIGLEEEMIVPSIEKKEEDPSLQHSVALTESQKVLEKVLEIDVIESSYIPNADEQQSEITHTFQIQKSQNMPEKLEKGKRSLQSIENEKQAILAELKKIDDEIAVIKGEPIEDINLKRRQKEIQEQKARKQAKLLVKQLNKQKKELEERKKKESEKQLLQLKQEEQQLRKKRKQDEERAKQERKKAIEQRMQEERRKRQQRKQMDKQSNRLLVQLKREQQISKIKESIPVEMHEVEQKKKVVEKRQEVNFKEIEQHERKYIFMKQQEKANRRDRSESQSHHPIPRYHKNTWIERLQEEEFKKKEEEKLKELQRKAQLEKRLKYGELVKNIFLPKKKEELRPSVEDIQKPCTPNAPTLPKIPQSEKRVTQSKAMKNFIEQNRPFATSHSYKKPPRPPKQEKQQKMPEFEIKQDIEKERQRKQRELQLRRQTNQRLKKLENKSLDKMPLQKSKPKYENYLGQIKLKKKDDSNWKEIIDNGKLSKQEKYTEMLKKANSLQARAKQKEQLRKDGDEDAVNLYIGSIQAKLALLQKF